MSYFPPFSVQRLGVGSDRYGSMITPRSNRESGNPGQIMRYFLASKKKKYDKKLSQALIVELGVYPPGTTVALSSGEVALVTHRGEDHFNPRVLALCSPEDIPYPQPITRDTRDEDYTISRFVLYPKVKQFKANLFWGDAANESEKEFLPQEVAVPIDLVDDV